MKPWYDETRAGLVMTSIRRNKRIMLLLVIWLALWDLSSSAVIRTVRSSEQDRDWWKDIFPDFDGKPTPSSEQDTRDWWKDLFPNFDGTPTPTPSPFDWNRITFKPWIRYTYPPDDSHHHHYHIDDTPLKLAVFLPTAIGIVIVLLCKYFVCNGESDSDTSTPILHQPPRRVVPPPTRSQFTNIQRSTTWTTSNQARQELVSTTASVNPPNSNGPPRQPNPTDKPPGYSDVVLADLMEGGQTHFPEVVRIIPETPPPPYDDKNIKY